jgi:hypothetical protein
MSLKHSISFVLLLNAPRLALAEDTKRECVDTSTLGQTHRNASQLLEAREQFLKCSREACPVLVRDTCSRWLAEVEELTPSVVIHATDVAEADITEGSATIDGVSYPLDGKTIPLNPGKHVVVVVGPDGARAEKKVLLASGEKSRRIELRLDSGRPHATEPVGANPPMTGVPSSDRAGRDVDQSSSIPTGAWVLGGISLVGFGGFALFGLSARSEFDKLKEACSPSCTDEQMQTGRTNALVADISLGLGVAALAGAVSWTVLARNGAQEPKTAARFSIVPTPRGGHASFSTPF